MNEEGRTGGVGDSVWSGVRGGEEDPEFIPRDRLFPPYGFDPENDPDGLLAVEYLPDLPGEPGYRPGFIWHEDDDGGA